MKDNHEKLDRRTQDLLASLKQVQLSDADFSALRQNLSTYADLHTVPARAIPSPFFSWELRLTSLRVAGALVAVFLVTGIGVSYASEGSLPGQPLYAVKVAVTEPIEGALIPTTSGKATWENVLAERRLAEASTLAAQNKLNDSTRVYLEQQVTVHTEKAENDADQLAASGNADAALAVRSDLEARLSAHAEVLAAIAPRLAEAGDASTTQQVAMLFQKVVAARTAAMQARIATEVALDAQASTTVSMNARTNAVRTFAARTAAPNAIVATANAQRETEEKMLFSKHIATLFALLPQASTTASSTASTSIPILPDEDATSTASTTTRTSATTTDESTTILNLTTPQDSGK